MHENASGYFAEADGLRGMWVTYAPDISQRIEPYLSPAHTNDLSGLPPTLVVTAEFDPLRDDGQAYSVRLRKAGVAAEYVCFDGMIHGFAQMFPITPRAAEAVGLIASRLRLIS